MGCTQIVKLNICSSPCTCHQCVPRTFSVIYSDMCGGFSCSFINNIGAGYWPCRGSAFSECPSSLKEVTASHVQAEFQSRGAPSARSPVTFTPEPQLCSIPALYLPTATACGCFFFTLSMCVCHWGEMCSLRLGLKQKLLQRWSGCSHEALQGCSWDRNKAEFESGGGQRTLGVEKETTAWCYWYFFARVVQTAHRSWLNHNVVILALFDAFAVGLLVGIGKGALLIVGNQNEGGVQRFPPVRRSTCWLMSVRLCWRHRWTWVLKPPVR